MGKIFPRLFEEAQSSPHYVCAECETQLVLVDSMISEHFRGRTGQAMLFKDVINVVLGPIEESEMTTGVHIIRCIYCVTCLKNVGWFYEQAFDDDQIYKEGRYILEERLINRILPGSSEGEDI